MVRAGVVIAVSGLMLACAPAEATMRTVGPKGVEARLRHEAVRRDVILTQEALGAFRASPPTRSRFGPGGAIAEGMLGGLIASDIARQANGHRTNAGVDDHPGAQASGFERMSQVTVRASVAGFLDALANIRVKVRPAPPRDYVVTINGRPYPASERSIYAIPPGVVGVSVSRRGKPPCHWAGTVNAEAEKVLDCKL